MVFDFVICLIFNVEKNKNIVKINSFNIFKICLSIFVFFMKKEM